jgi:hypothetical protein
MIRGEIMVNNNLNINLNSIVLLNSINYKSNQHRKSFHYKKTGLLRHNLSLRFFHCDVVQNYNKFSDRGDRLLIFPWLFLVMIHCQICCGRGHLLQRSVSRWNTIAFSRQISSVARGSNFVALEASSSNVISMHGKYHMFFASNLSCGNNYCLLRQFGPYGNRLTIMQQSPAAAKTSKFFGMRKFIA